MFKYTLENGKKQFFQGLVLSIVAIALAILTGLVWLIPTAKEALLIISGSLGFGAACFGIPAFVKLIFGAVVYHAEKTAK